MTWTLRIVMRRSSAVGQRAGEEHEDEPGQPARDGDAGDQRAGTWSGSDAISGRATRKMPSARLAAAEDVHNLR